MFREYVEIIEDFVVGGWWVLEGVEGRFYKWGSGRSWEENRGCIELYGD